MSGISHGQKAPAWNFYHNPRHPYDDFIANYILKPLKFSFVQKQYDRPLAEFVRELPELMYHFSTSCLLKAACILAGDGAQP